MLVPGPQDPSAPQTYSIRPGGAECSNPAFVGCNTYRPFGETLAVFLEGFRARLAGG